MFTFVGKKSKFNKNNLIVAPTLECLYTLNNPCQNNDPSCDHRISRQFVKTCKYKYKEMDHNHKQCSDIETQRLEHLCHWSTAKQ